MHVQVNITISPLYTKGTIFYTLFRTLFFFHFIYLVLFLKPVYRKVPHSVSLFFPQQLHIVHCTE